LTESQPEIEAELPLLSAPRHPVHYLTDLSKLEQAVSELMSGSGPIAIDAERASGFRYSQRAYLVQLKNSSSDIFLLDPMQLSETMESKPFAELRSFLRDQEWILHAATQDLGCLAELGLTPGAIFDTELAARLAGQPRVGLGSLTESLMKMRLAKEHSAADWSTRPLPESWLNYAALDVDVLHELKGAVGDLLSAQQKSQWAKEEFDALLTFRPKPQREDRWRGVTGASKLADRLSLEIVRRLWHARESLAIKLDVAPGRLIPDSAISAAAAAKPKSKSELASLKTFSGRASRSYLALWWDAIAESYRTTDLPALRPERQEAIPNHRNWASKFPEADLRLRLAKSELVKISEQYKLPLENLLTPDLLRQVSFNPPKNFESDEIASALRSLGARSWQTQLVSQAIAEAFIRSLKPQPNPAEQGDQLAV